MIFSILVRPLRERLVLTIADVLVPVMPAAVIVAAVMLAATALGQPPERYGTLVERRPAPGIVRRPTAPAAERPVPALARRNVDRGVVPAFYPAPVEEQEAVAIAAPPRTVLEQIGIGSPGEHPLMPAIRWAKTGTEKLTGVRDYSCTLVKRERIDGQLGEHEYMFVKVRHQPFSVYIYFLGPARVKGQEAIYVEGQNEGHLLAHPNGAKGRIFRLVRLKPDSLLAMTGNKYPITDLGIRRLTERLIEVAEHDAQFGECEVKYLPGAKVDKRDCTCIEVVHPVPRRDFLFHKARIFVDTEHNLPVRYEAYQWPQEPGGQPVLDEEYTYINLKVNGGFTDLDFDPENPEYRFR